MMYFLISLFVLIVVLAVRIRKSQNYHSHHPILEYKTIQKRKERRKKLPHIYELEKRFSVVKAFGEFRRATCPKLHYKTKRQLK